MSLQVPLSTIIQNPTELEKQLLENMNTNHSLALSQTLGDKECQMDQRKNASYRTKQTIVTENLQSYIPEFSSKKVSKDFDNESRVPTHRDIELLMDSLKIIAFLAQQNTDKKRLIQNKQLALKKIRSKIDSLQELIKRRKQEYLIKVNNYKHRSQRIKTSTKSINKRLATEIVDLRQKIYSIKKTSTINPSSSRINTSKEIKERRNSLRFYTQRSSQKKIFVPLLPYGFHNVNMNNQLVQFYSRTIPISNPQHHEQANQLIRTTPKNFIRTNLFQAQHQNPEYKGKKEQEPQNTTKRGSQNSNILEILGQHMRIPPTINSIESLTCNKLHDSLSEKKESYYERLLDSQSQQGSIRQGETIERAKDNNKLTIQVQQQNDQEQSKVIKFLPSDFKIGNLGDSVQSQYTDSQKCSQQFFKMKVARKSQSSQDYSISSSDDKHQKYDDIIESIKLTSHSKIFKQRISESKYIPSSYNPANLVANSELLNLNLLPESNISVKRGKNSNSKIIKKKMASIEVDKSSPETEAHQRLANIIDEKMSSMMKKAKMVNDK